MHVINNLTLIINILTIALTIEITTTSQDIVLLNEVTIYDNVSILI